MLFCTIIRVLVCLHYLSPLYLLRTEARLPRLPMRVLTPSPRMLVAQRERRVRMP